MYDRAVYHELWRVPNSVTKSQVNRYTLSAALTMTKPPEEGLIWEWRAFGTISEPLAAKVRAYPIRQGISDLQGEDIYLVSPESDQNVKLRRSDGDWLLKLKLLIKSRKEHYELYNEAGELMYEFPVSADQLKAAALLLGVTLSKSPKPAERFTDNQFTVALEDASPPVPTTRVSKRRSQYQFDGGWVELAEVNFQFREVESISIHSPDIETVKAIVNELAPGEALEPMNYIMACRRWGFTK